MENIEVNNGNTVTLPVEKSGIRKILVWVIIIIVLLGILFMVYSYIAQDSTSENGVNGGNVASADGDNMEQQVTGETEDEKPPRPPE